MKISFLLAWYDVWVGLFWDKKKKWLYILPIPMAGIILKFGKPKIDTHQTAVHPILQRDDERSRNLQKIYKAASEQSKTKDHE